MIKILSCNIISFGIKGTSHPLRTIKNAYQARLMKIFSKVFNVLMVFESHVLVRCTVVVIGMLGGWWGWVG